MYDARQRGDVRVGETMIEFEGTPPPLLPGQRVIVEIDTASPQTTATGQRSDRSGPAPWTQAGRFSMMGPARQAEPAAQG